jgi:hypothetical protein
MISSEEEKHPRRSGDHQTPSSKRLLESSLSANATITNIVNSKLDECCAVESPTVLWKRSARLLMMHFKVGDCLATNTDIMGRSTGLSRMRMLVAQRCEPLSLSCHE